VWHELSLRREKRQVKGGEGSDALNRQTLERFAGGGVWKVGSGSGILEAHLMSRSLHAPIAPGRIVGACVCLIAVLLLWTPMWASAWMMRGMACCTGTMCAAHLHTKTNAPAKSGAECEHSRGAGMAACSMSCCHEEDASLTVNGGAYVLPEAVEIAAPAETVSLAVVVKHEEVMQVFAPPSPPPESSVL
jgi:hypothetical protein